MIKKWLLLVGISVLNISGMNGSDLPIQKNGKKDMVAASSLIRPLDFTGISRDVQRIIAEYLSQSWLFEKSLTYHTTMIGELCFSPDSNYLASRSKRAIDSSDGGAGAGIINLWNIEHETRKIVKNSNDKMSKITFLSDGTLIPTARALGLPENAVILGYNAVYSPDGKYFATPYQIKNSIAIFDVNTRKLYLSFEAVNIDYLDFSSDSKYFAYASHESNSINVINLVEQKKITLKSSLKIAQIVFVPHEPELICVSSANGEKQVINIMTGHQCELMQGEPDEFFNNVFAFSPNNKYMAVNKRNAIELLRSQKFDILEPMGKKIEKNPVILDRQRTHSILKVLNTCLPVPITHNIIADYLDDWDLVTHVPRERFNDQLVISPLGKYIATYNEKSNIVKLWHIGKERFVNKFDVGELEIVRAFFSFDEKSLLIQALQHDAESNGSYNCIKLYDVNSGLEKKAFDKQCRDLQAVFSSDNKKLVSWCGCGWHVYIHDLLTGETTQIDTSGGQTVIACALVNNTNKLAIFCKADSSYSLKIVDLTTRQCVSTIYLDNEIVTDACCFSINGDLFAAVIGYNYYLDDGLKMGTHILKIIDTVSGKHLQTYFIEKSFINKVNFDTGCSHICSRYISMEKEGQAGIKFVDLKDSRKEKYFSAKQMAGIIDLPLSHSSLPLHCSLNRAYIIAARATNKIENIDSDADTDADEDLATSVIVYQNLGILMREALARRVARVAALGGQPKPIEQIQDEKNNAANSTDNSGCVIA